MVVIKRDGREVSFDKAKIRDAAYRALCEVDRLHPVENKENLAERVANGLAFKYKNLHRAISVEEIQDDVENRLMEEGFYEVAKAYIKYRYEHELLRNMSTLDGKVLSIADNVNETVIQENSNKNPAILSTQRDYIAGELSRDITNRLLLPEEITKAHEEGIIHFHDSDYYLQRMHNCFSSGTKFVTNEGVVAFSDCYDGQKVVILDKDGCWRDAIVHHYGTQKLYDITIRSTRSEKNIVCTRDHRWILKDGSVTTNLSVGDSLYALHDSTVTNREMTKRDSEMFAFGFILGDGVDLERGLQVRLCGHKTEYRDVFAKADYRCYEIKNGDLVFTKACGLSKQDFLDKSIWKYLSSYDKETLFRGLYAADGSRDRNQICTSDTRILAMIQDISAIAGYHISSIKVVEHDTNFKTGAVLYCVNFRTKQNPNNLWTVDKIEPHRKGTLEQDVWCVEEPITHSFTLNGGIVTGNCCLVNLEDMLQNGTVISGTLIEKPHSFSTACNIATQIIAQVASNQYGGQSISLAHLAPFVDVSRQKIRKEVEEEFKLTDHMIRGGELVEFSDSVKSAIAEVTERRVREEVKRGVQTIQYQVITLMTTNGQAPFITVFMYLNEVGDPQTKHDLAMIIEETVRQRMEGVKNEKGIWVTPAFPKLIYVLEDDNIEPDTPYYYLTELCAKCSVKRLVPDYISEKKMLENKVDANGGGHCYTCMGCRSFLTPYLDENSNPKYYGRLIIVIGASLNLVNA